MSNSNGLPLNPERVEAVAHELRIPPDEARRMLEKEKLREDS